MSTDPHAPGDAGPDPEEGSVEAVTRVSNPGPGSSKPPAPEPTPVVTPSEATAEHPAGSAATAKGTPAVHGDPPQERSSAGAESAKETLQHAAVEAKRTIQGYAATVQETAQSAAASPQDAVATIQGTVKERPEALVGAAFAGGFMLAILLKRLG